jgi:hypothetical protein
MKKIAIAAVAGGVVMFLWGAVSHMLTPLGEAGIRSLPNEEPVLAALRTNVAEPGLYFYPGMDERARSTDEGRREWEQRYTAGPSGLMVHHPQGGQTIGPTLLGTELLADIFAVALAAWTASHARTFGRRLAIVTAFGVAAWFSIEVSYWNWYGFPSAYVLAQLVDQVLGFALAGLVVAKIVRPQFAE